MPSRASQIQGAFSPVDLDIHQDDRIATAYFRTEGRLLLRLPTITMDYNCCLWVWLVSQGNDSDIKEYLDSDKCNLRQGEMNALWFSAGKQIQIVASVTRLSRMAI